VISKPFTQIDTSLLNNSRRKKGKNGICVMRGNLVRSSGIKGSQRHRGRVTQSWREDLGAFNINNWGDFPAGNGAELVLEDSNALLSHRAWLRLNIHGSL